MSSRAILAVCATLVACGATVNPSNPYDPTAPPDTQAKGKISGTITAEASFSASDLRLTIDGADTSGLPVTGVTVVQVVQGAGVAFSAQVPPGTYHLLATIPGFDPLDRFGIPVGVGASMDLGTVELSVGRGSLKGTLVARTPGVGQDAAPPPDASITLFRLGSDFAGAGSGVACTLPDFNGTETATLHADGSFEATNIAAGPYLVLAERDGYVPAVTARSVVVAPGGEGDAGLLVLLSGQQMIRFSPAANPAADPASPATNNLAVGLSLVIPPVYSGMRISADSTFSDPALGDTDFGVAQDTINWTLPSGDGERTLYVQYRAPTCRTSPVFEGSILVDTKAPVADAPRLVSGATCSNTSQVSLQLGGSDPCPAGSACAGLYKMALSLDGNIADAAWVDFAPQTTVDLGSNGRKSLAFALRDRAGNQSAPANATLAINTTGPVVTNPAVQVNGQGGGATVKSLDVTLAFQVTGATFVEVGNAAGLDGTHWAAFPPSGTLAWRLVDGTDGARSVVAHFKDDCGNVTAEFATPLILDRSSDIRGVSTLNGASANDSTTVSALLLAGSTYTDIGKSTVTGPDGAFSIGGLAAGTYRLSFAHAGYVSRTVDGLAVGAGVDFVAPSVALDVARGDITGHATLAGETSHDGIQVSAGSAVAFTDATGAYHLSGLPTGQYLLQAQKGVDFSSTTSGTLVTVTQGGTATAPDMTLQPVPGTLSGSALLAGKPAIAGISVLVEGLTVYGSPKNSSTVTDSSGAFSVTDLTAGSYTVTVSEAGYRTLTQPGVVVSPNQTASLGTLTLQAATGEVVGKALLSGSTSSAGVRASLAQSGVEIAFAISGDDGSYDVKGVPAGSYTLTLSRLGFGAVTVPQVQVTADALVAIPVQTLTPQVGQVSLVGVGVATNQTTVNVTGNYPNAVSARFCEDPAVTDPDNFTLAACPETALTFTASPPNFDPVPLTFKGSPVSDGAKTIYVQFTDSTSATSNWFSVPVVLDRLPPSGSVVISPLDSTLVNGAVQDQGAPYTSSPTVSVLIAGSDTLSGLAQAQLYRGAADANPLVVPMSDGTRLLEGVSLAAGADGARQLILVLTDVAGNASVTNLGAVSCPDPLASGVVPAACDSIFLDTTPPPSCAFSINPVNPAGDLSAGSAYATSPVVQLGIDSTLTGKPQDAAVSAVPANDPNFTTSFVQPLPAPRGLVSWVLTPGDGAKTVYLKIRNGAGVLSGVFQASTTLITAAPDVPALNPVAAVTQNRSPALSFGAAAGAATYQVQLSPAADFSALVATSPASPFAGTSTAPASPLADGAYYWRARSANVAGVLSAWSGSGLFTVDTTAPAVPLLAAVASPTNHNAPVLSWTRISDAAQYTVQLDTSAAFNSGALVTAVATDDVYAPAPLADGTWFAHVNAVDAAGNASAYSAAISFTVDTVAPANPGLIAPANGAILASSSVTVSWNAIAGASSYLLQISSDPSLAAPDQYAVTGTQRTLVLANGNWTFRVGALDAAGNASNIAAATSRTITVDSAAPTGSSIAINGGATYATALGVTLSFSAAADVTQLAVAEGAINCGSATYQSFAPTLAFTLGGQGQRTVFACFKTGAGLTASASASIIADTIAPAGTLTIAGGAAEVQQLATVLAFTASADTVAMAVVNGTSLTCATATYSPFSATLPWTLATGPDGARNVTACLKDAAGNTSNVSGGILLDTTPPSGATLAINSGAATTTSASVTLNLTTPETVTVALANEQLDCGTATYGAFSATVASWGLLNQDGVRTVVACFKDAAGWIVTKSATILLDRVAPSGTLTINGGAQYATSFGVTLAFSSMSDVTQLAYGEGINCGSATYSAFAPGAAFTLSSAQGPHTVTACYKDAAGNIAQASAGIIAATVPPTGSIVVGSGSGYVQSALTSVQLTASTGVTQMSIVNASSLNCATAVYVPYSASSAWTLLANDGPKNVTACLKDVAGNTASFSAGVTLDGTPPTTATLAIDSGASTTTSQSVALAMTTPETVTVALGNETLDCTSATYGAFAASVPSWNLLNQDGVRTVVACIKDLAGNVAMKTATILLDRAPPAGTVLINAGAAYTQSNLVTLNFASTPDVVSYSAALNTLNCGTATYTGFVPSLSNFDLDPGATGVDGSKTVAVCYKDGAGNTSSASATISLDRVNPTGTLVLAGGAPVVNTRTINVQVQSASAGVTSMAIAEGSLTCASAAYSAFTASTTFTLSSSETTKTVVVCLQKASGRTASLSQTITLDVTPPTGSIAINAGATWTKSATVTVTGNATGAAFYALGNESIDCVAAAYTAMGTTFTNSTWTLTPSDGLRTVVACLKDLAGNLATVQTTIQLDTRAPVIDLLTIAGGVPAVQTDTVTLAIDAIESASTAAQMQMYLSRDGSFTDGAWEAYATTKTWDLNGAGANVTANASVYLKVQDAAGNVSSAVSRSIVLDFNNPVLNGVVSSVGTNPQTATHVSLTLNAQDTAPGTLAEVMVSEDNTFANAAWTSVAWTAGAGSTFNASVGFNLSSSDGPKTIYARVRDLSQRVSGLQSTGVILDTTAPTALNGTPTVTLSNGYDTNASLSVSMTALDANAASGLKFGLYDAGNGALNCGNATYVAFTTAGGSCNAGSCSVSSYAYTFTSSAQGAHTLAVCFKDFAGNTSSIPYNVPFSIDSAAPAQVQGLVLEPGSRQMLASFGAVTDALSGLDHYDVQYSIDPTFAAGLTTISTTSTSVTVSPLTNWQSWYLHVRAVDKAGNAGAWSNAGSAVPGLRQVNTASFTYRGGLLPQVSYAEGTLWLSGVTGNCGVVNGTCTPELARCNALVNDCTDPKQWGSFSLSTPSNTLSAFETAGVRDPMHLVVATSQMMLSGMVSDNASSTPVPVVWVCNRGADCVDFGFNWSPLELEAPSTGVLAGHIAMAANSSRAFVAYERNTGSSATIRVASCSLLSDCSLLANWTKIDLAGGPSVNGSSLSVVANDQMAAVGFYGNAAAPQESNVAVCSMLAFPFNCASASSWSAPYNPTPQTTAWTQTAPQITLTPNRLYMSYSYDGGALGGKQVVWGWCSISSGCTAQGNWTFNNISSFTPPFNGYVTGTLQSVDLHYGNDALHAAYWDDNAQAVVYGTCPSPDANDCKVVANWRFMTAASSVSLATTPAVSNFDGNVVVAFMDTKNRWTVVMPKVTSPLFNAEGPGIGALVGNWTPELQLAGYQQVYDATPGPNWASYSVVTDPTFSQGSIPLAPSTSDTYSALRSYDDQGEISDDAPWALARPLSETVTNGQQLNFSSCNGNIQYNCPLFATASSGTRVVTLMGSAAANGSNTLSWCDQSVLTGSTSCAAGGTSVALGVNETGLGVTVDVNRVYVLSAAGSSVFVRWCDALAPGNSACQTGSNWTSVTLPTATSASNVQLAARSNEIYVAYVDTSNFLRVDYCSNASNTCNSPASWTRDMVAANEASTYGYSMVRDYYGYLHIARATATALKYYACAGAGCSTPNVGTLYSRTSPALSPTPDTVKLALDANNQPTLVAHWDGHVHAAICNSNVFTYYYCSLSNGLNLWSIADLGPATFSSGLETDVTSAAGRRYILYSNVEDEVLATCHGDCGKSDAWKSVTVTSGYFAKPGLGSRPLFNDGASGLIGFGRAVQTSTIAPLTYSMHLLTGGKYQPRD